MPLLLTGAEVLDVARQALVTLLMAAGPIMLFGLALGLVVAIFQSVTQIQEMTLTFVPKIIAVFAATLFLLPNIGRRMNSFMQQIFDLMIAG
ncbi:flagellar biosynthetic protein FliQ [Rhodothalassium salexigens DSM 2132]|uniref:Flagellar biosynthetic protein FliQ n=1 Tax=Rhodothalassium salexigens DSM 2132 TaxID=1188247 RepID=A0A4R2PEH6_RHOSA|nr:flagellar biosynthetic protein FliQ [Rhodothalassium salexigens]MBB4212298.1 flagellar biosynthetic protein FliQ [Rhodothalassium salexigens DSM 2132]TCP32551.1 flagellar biosynthetic protein FliQ [Rhodothalassium salexigens DSM 2132]